MESKTSVADSLTYVSCRVPGPSPGIVTPRALSVLYRGGPSGSPALGGTKHCWNQVGCKGQPNVQHKKPKQIICCVRVFFFQPENTCTL